MGIGRGGWRWLLVLLVAQAWSFTGPIAGEPVAVVTTEPALPAAASAAVPGPAAAGDAASPGTGAAGWPGGLDLAAMEKILAAAEKVRQEKIPEALTKKRGPFDKGNYDPNRHLAAFPALRLEPGKTLDFVYDLQELGGHPVVYARPATATPFASLAEFKKENPRRYFLGDPVRFQPQYLPAIQADGTPDGFLQLAMLVLTSEQFYIFWHASYYVLWPVIDRPTLDDIVKTTIPPDLQASATALDVTPHVAMATDSVAVDYVVFTPWGGFKRIFWTVSRVFPHRFLGVREEVILKYESRIRF
ncbi:MAG: hypothetical protein GX442_05960 [Candidatus Riflebacteria bacterium]|nr:hypothetical protein [Candidatus Riflebacteria bacterium]